MFLVQFHYLLTQTSVDLIVEEWDARGASEPRPRIRSHRMQVEIVDDFPNARYYGLDPKISRRNMSHCISAHHREEQDPDQTKVRS